jgi:transcription-repair coupling factor (superfamily II helicase)
MLSRFRSKKEQHEIVGRIETGDVDIIIGTHRLLSEDVKFKDLGLLVIDEEHRFGVKHKEKLRKLRSIIDVLSLSATPIPRTLQMALTGARDLSLITTPPRDRHPIITEIRPFSPHLIREAIQYEIDRGGQVFFVHNRIESIYRLSEFLEELMPHVTFRVAHGQMAEDHLETVMVDFYHRKFDVLISTMIIESGLDIPNVNTLIVNRADRLGLAQLYQLRGRVGRSHHQAYAYLLIPSKRKLTPTARKRLDVIEAHTGLGSGYQIAMRDLEMRGAGNILGAQQHGFIISVGFEMYCRMLEEAISESRGQAKSEAISSEIQLPVDAFLPDTYIDTPLLKVDIYRRLGKAQNINEVMDLREELEDRFGEIPITTDNLLKLRVLALQGGRIGLERMKWSGSTINLEFQKDSPITPKKLQALIEDFGDNVELTSDVERFRIKVKASSNTALEVAEKVMESIPH